MSDSRLAMPLFLPAWLACAVITCAGVAFLVTRRILRPLRTLAESIERTGATHLHERVPIGGWPDELQPLAISFNKMLARLEDSFTRLSQFSADLAHELRTPDRHPARRSRRGPHKTAHRRAISRSHRVEPGRNATALWHDRQPAFPRARGNHWLTQSPVSSTDARPLKRYANSTKQSRKSRAWKSSGEGEGQVYAEPVLFRRALINLITNALRFTPSGGRITVSLAASGRRERGCGRRHRLRHFIAACAECVQPFFPRRRSAQLPRDTGLGLSIVKSIMQIHNGTVSVQSDFGRGTVVTLSFPDARLWTATEPLERAERDRLTADFAGDGNSGFFRA